jgi:PBP1b-binding outer membrane lipoprotein LpoB
MRMTLKMLSVAVIALSVVGCEDKPHEYGRERPPIDQIDSGGHGLQSKDVTQAADQMAMKLLSLPALNQSETKWTIVTQAMENQTVSQRQSLDIFVDALKSRLAEQGGDRIALIENRDRFHDLQARELEGAAQEGASVPAGIQPQYALYGKMQELPNRGTSTYRAEFTLTNFKTREIVWTGEYIVKVRR